MTDLEKRLQTARAKSHKALARAELARKKLDLDCRAYREKRTGAVDAAHKAARAAIAAVTALELDRYAKRMRSSNRGAVFLAIRT